MFGESNQNVFLIQRAASSSQNSRYPSSIYRESTVHGVHYFVVTHIAKYSVVTLQAFFDWGYELRKQFGIFNGIYKAKNASQDISLNYLGYWTDNGKIRARPRTHLHLLHYQRKCTLLWNKQRHYRSVFFHTFAIVICIKVRLP